VTPAWLRPWHLRRLLSTPAEVVAGTFTGLYDGDAGLGRRTLSRSYLERRNVPAFVVYAAAALAAYEESLPHGPHDEIAVWEATGTFCTRRPPPVRRGHAGLA